MKNKTLITVRYVVLAFFLILFTFYSIRHYVLGGQFAASVDALCPFGGFETLFTFIATGGFVPRIFMSSLILAIGVVITVIIFKKGFCGYICPFGTVQEILGKTKKKKLALPKKVDKTGRLIKYLILAIILIGTGITGTLIFRAMDPFVTFFHFGKGLFWSEYESEKILPFVVTVVVLAMAIFVNRAWCRYFCPLAAVMNIFSWFGFTSIKRNKNKCIDCKACDRVCPVDVKISTIKKVKDIECINCTQCITKCPKKALGLRFFNGKLSVFIYVFALIVVFFAVIGAAKGFGIWQSIPGSTVEHVGGNLDGNSIQGWMSLQIVSDQTGICLHHFLNEMDLPDNVDVNLALNQYRNVYNIDFHAQAVRDFVNDFEHDEEDTNEDNIFAPSEPACPWQIKDDSYPGDCGLFVDKDGDSLCDLSK